MQIVNWMASDGLFPPGFGGKRSPSPRPSPPGEGETLAASVADRLGKWVRLFRARILRAVGADDDVRTGTTVPIALPLLGERAGVRADQYCFLHLSQPILGANEDSGEPHAL